MNRRQLLQSVLSLPTVKSIEVSTVTPRDVIVIECDGPIRVEDAERMREQLERCFPNNQVLILGDRLHLTRGGP